MPLFIDFERRVTFLDPQLLLDIIDFCAENLHTITYFIGKFALAFINPIDSVLDLLFEQIKLLVLL